MSDLNQAIEAYAANARALYCEERNRWHMEHESRETMWGSGPLPADGGEDAHGRKHKNVWQQVARFVLENHLDLRRFIRAQFSIRSSKPIAPNQLLTDAALSLYKYQERNDAGEVERLFKFQLDRLQMECNKRRPYRTQYGWSDRDIVRAVLGNRLLSLSALFRYCLAAREAYDDLTETFYSEAVSQYITHPDDYDRVWGVLLPPAFQRAARGLVAYAAKPAASSSPEAVAAVTVRLPRAMN